MTTGSRRPWLGLPWPVWLLGGVSLLTDAATEAIYPLLPFFLTQVLGAGAVSLGVIEGVAEATSSILKIVSGRLSDRWNRRKPIIIAGYGFSSLARPFISLATTWPAVFLLRFLDRVGKGIRGAPRDAMLAGLAEPATRGRVYGFHRAMDNAGAVVGPLLATLFLLAYPSRYRTLFAPYCSCSSSPSRARLPSPRGVLPARLPTPVLKRYPPAGLPPGAHCRAR